MDSSPRLHVVVRAPERDSGDLIRVVLVHGSLDRGSTFARVVRRLAALAPELELVTYDRRGYHRSRDARLIPTVDSDAFDLHVEDLLAIADRPSVVVGHSLGADIVLGAAIRAPSQVLAAGAFEPPVPWMDWWPARSSASLLEEDPATFAEGFFRRVAGSELWDRLPQRVKAERRADGAALVAELASIRRDQPPFDITKLTVPLVLGRGEKSLAHHRRAVEALADAADGSEVVEIAGAAHGAHISHVDEFARFVLRVVDEARSALGLASGPGA